MIGRVGHAATICRLSIWLQPNDRERAPAAALELLHERRLTGIGPRLGVDQRVVGVGVGHQLEQQRVAWSLWHNACARNIAHAPGTDRLDPNKQSMLAVE